MNQESTYFRLLSGIQASRGSETLASRPKKGDLVQSCSLDLDGFGVIQIQNNEVLDQN